MIIHFCVNYHFKITFFITLCLSSYEMSFDAGFMVCLFLKHHLLTVCSRFDRETNQPVLSSLHKKMSRVSLAVLHYPHAWDSSILAFTRRLIVKCVPILKLNTLCSTWTHFWVILTNYAFPPSGWLMMRWKTKVKLYHKGIVYWKKKKKEKISSSFTHYDVVPNMHACSSVEQKSRYFEECWFTKKFWLPVTFIMWGKQKKKFIRVWNVISVSKWRQKDFCLNCHFLVYYTFTSSIFP